MLVILMLLLTVYLLKLALISIKTPILIQIFSP